MDLNTAQLTTLKAAIAAETDPTFVAYRTAGSTGAMAEWYNAASTFIVYKSRVATNDLGMVVLYVAVAAMTTANQTQLNLFYTLNPTDFDPSRTDIQDYFNSTFSGALGGQGQATRDALAAYWRRAAKKGERIFATGTGSTAVPGKLVAEGNMTDQNIVQAIYQV